MQNHVYLSTRDTVPSSVAATVGAAPALTTTMPDVLIVTAASTGLLLRDVPHISRFVEVLPAYPSAASPGAFAPRATGAATVEESAAAAAEAAKFLPEMTKEDLTTAAMSARQSCCGQWLVFANEGVCLTHLFFVADKGGSGLLEPVGCSHLSSANGNRLLQY